MKHQALFSSKDKKKKCRLLQFLFGSLRHKEKMYIPVSPNAICFLYPVFNYTCIAIIHISTNVYIIIK